MHWFEPKPVFQPDPAVQVELLRRALDRRAADPALRERLGIALIGAGDYAGAVGAFEAAAKTAPQRFGAWASLADCYARLQRLDLALDACRRGEAQQPASAALAAIHSRRGNILQMQGRNEQAEAAFRTAYELGHVGALTELLKALARKPGGSELLAFCDALPTNLRKSALVLGHRAIALSRLGRTVQARRLVDLERQVAQISLRSPPAFDSMESYNRALTAEILASKPPDPARTGFYIEYDTNAFRGPAYRALRTLVQSAIDGYLAEAEARGLNEIMPPPPDPGVLAGASVVLHGAGRNGEHLHASGYVSCVYYVSVPDRTGATDKRGYLVLGKCDEYTAGYQPCWDTRHVKPVEGNLVVFPSHIFHDVVPTGSEVPRISVAADLRADAISRRARVSLGLP